MRLCFGSLCALILTASAQTAAATPATEAFNKLKAFAGQWTVASEGSEPEAANYEIVSDGSVVMERLYGMTTMYSLDGAGETIVATHYCSAHNQPRFKAVEITNETIRFEETDVSGLPHPGAGHMARLIVRFESTTSFKQSWTWREDGVDAAPHEISWTRTP